MTQDPKQNPDVKNDGLDLERLRQNTAGLKTAQTGMSPKNQDKSWSAAAFMLSAAIEFAILLAAPLIGAIFLGRWLTAKYHSSAYSIIALLAALTISAVAIALDIKKISKKVRNK